MPRTTPFRTTCLALAAAGAMLLAAFAQAATSETATGRPLPRFVSLNADEVNLRTGPGVRFPIDWVYKRRYLPVEVIAEYDTWRKIRDWEGTEGWVHRAMLSGKRSVMVTIEMATLRSEPSPTAPAVARLGRGMVALVDSCDQGWCDVEVGKYEGWLKRDGLYGLYTDEPIE